MSLCAIGDSETFYEVNGAAMPTIAHSEYVAIGFSLRLFRLSDEKKSHPSTDRIVRRRYSFDSSISNFDDPSRTLILDQEMAVF